MLDVDESVRLIKEVMKEEALPFSKLVERVREKGYTGGANSCMVLLKSLENHGEAVLREGKWTLTARIKS